MRKALIGAEGGEEQWRYCVTDTNTVLGMAVGAMFVREMFQGDAKAKVSKNHYLTVLCYNLARCLPITFE